MPSLTPQAAALDARYGIANRLTFETMYGGPVAVLTHGTARAVVALQGAQVLSYSTRNCGETLWLSPLAKLGTGKAVRGGIPICWPWFGPHPQDNSCPAHGFVRTRDWQVQGCLAIDNRVGLTLSLPDDNSPSAGWPHSTAVQVEIELSDQLSVSLSTTNLDTQAIRLTQALHTYLRVGDISQARIDGLQNKPFIDQLQRHVVNSEASHLCVTQEIDRIYQELDGPITVSDASLNRRIVVSKKHSRSTVVWNPWIDKSIRLGDMGEEGYRQMVCIETANAGGDIRTVAPQETCRLETTIATAFLEAPMAQHFG